LHLISSSVEHAAIHEILRAFELKGGAVTYLPAGHRGAVTPQQVIDAIRPETGLITLIGVNNETGVVTDVEQIGAIAADRNIPMLVDGVSWLGKAPFQLYRGLSAVFFAGHKLYAPQGTGFCICSRSFKTEPLFLGGSQEKKRRPGTENVAGITALALAVELLRKENPIPYVTSLRERFERQLLTMEGVYINGEGARASNVSNLAFTGIDGETLLIALDEQKIFASHGSACSSGAFEPSRVLLGMGLPLHRVRSSIRFSFGKTNTVAEVDRAVAVMMMLMRSLRC
jgi:cysteine desulfurase